MTRRPRVAWAILCAAGLAACAGPPATPEQRRLGEQRLLAPFLRDAEVGCGELAIDITGNFHPHVGQPAIDPATQSVARTHGDGYRETVWTNKTGDPARAFVLTIGQPPEITERGVEPAVQMRFRVLHQIRLRVYEDRRPLTLDVRAAGDFVLLREPGSRPREIERFEVSGGVATVR
ncbi:MAG: hypothetical protein KF830_01770 [Planctomycetes bacterium]|nr:hypothetical protein [Planctomycetota bacterium]